eukprot:4088233-Prorocentrum_lima.AAC.1
MAASHQAPMREYAEKHHTRNTDTQPTQTTRPPHHDNHQTPSRNKNRQKAQQAGSVASQVDRKKMQPGSHPSHRCGCLPEARRAPVG